MKTPAKFFLISTPFLMMIASQAMAGGPCGGQGGQGCSVQSQEVITTSSGRTITHYVLRDDAGLLIDQYEDNQGRITHLTKKEKRLANKEDRKRGRKERRDDRMQSRIDRVVAKKLKTHAEIESYEREQDAIAKSLGGRAVTETIKTNTTEHSSTSNSTNSVSTHESITNVTPISVQVDYSYDIFKTPPSGVCPEGMIISDDKTLCVGSNRLTDVPCDETTAVNQASEDLGAQGKGGQGANERKPAAKPAAQGNPAPAKPAAQGNPAPAKPAAQGNPAPAKPAAQKYTTAPKSYFPSVGSKTKREEIKIVDVRPIIAATNAEIAAKKKAAVKKQQKKKIVEAKKDPCEDEMKFKNSEIAKLNEEKAKTEAEAKAAKEASEKALLEKQAALEAAYAKTKALEDNTKIRVRFKGQDKFKEKNEDGKIKMTNNLKIKGKQPLSAVLAVINARQDLQNTFTKNVNTLTSKPSESATEVKTDTTDTKQAEDSGSGLKLSTRGY